ncbi:MAG: hypothetical protein PHS93_02820 [Candidatus Omnitrophica bacterium]|nr:hypothetical protein [Candidatus Omnitrophota bacterium]MDD5352083.1 hypothetical protein [Candidatus Omnitrophota bacterium]MDD5549681.1 hypothetical protein [Candidatus Omnitrophota bacterium]
MKRAILTLLLFVLIASPVFSRDKCDESRYGIETPVRVEPVIHREDFRGESLGDAKEFVVYLDKGDKQNHYVPSGWIGDYGDIKMNEGDMVNPHSGSTAIQFIYNAKKSNGQGWAGVYWQSSVNNWGSKIGGFDLSSMTKVTFWAKGAKGGEVIQKFMIGGIKGEYADSTLIEFGPVELTNTWTQYTINVAGKDLSYINGGFGWATTADLNADGCNFYLDDIKFEADPAIKPQGRQPQNMPFYVYSDRGSANNHFVPSGWMGDYGDIKYDGASKENPYSGNTCIKINYCACAYQGARWAGIYWQNPANNWGNIDAGYDLSKATKLTFWARGAKGGEYIDNFKVGGIGGQFGDSGMANIGPIVLNKEWTQYTIDLTGKNMTSIIGGFCWMANMDKNPQEFDFYLDEIKFE